MSEPRRILASKARRRTPTRRQTPDGKIESDEEEPAAPGAINRAQFDALNPDERMDFAISNRCVFDAKTDLT